MIALANSKINNIMLTKSISLKIKTNSDIISKNAIC